MKNITIEDCHELERKFRDYTKIAEQHEFPMLLAMEMRLIVTIDTWEKAGEVTDQQNANAMFRVILRMIGEDCTEYLEENVNADNR